MGGAAVDGLGRMGAATVANGESQRRARAVLVTLLALVAAAVYANSLSNGFAFDDQPIIASRDLVHGLGNLAQLLSVDYWPAGFVSGVYRPITLLSFALDWTIWNGHPFGFHLTNVVLHGATTGLVALLLLQYFPMWAALAGGLVFAVHPVHTEAVANVVGRGELFAALFVLIACLVYIRAARSGVFSPAVIALIASSYALAALSKEIGFVLPGLLVATDLALYRKGHDPTIGTMARARLPLFLALAGVMLGVLALRRVLLGAALGSVPDTAFALDSSFPTRLFTMARVWPRYFELLLFPTDLSADYSPAVILPADGLTPLGALGFFVVLSTLTAAALTLRRAPEFSMAVAWAAITIVPVSNLLIPVQLLLAERTLYLTSVSVSIIVSLLLSSTRPGSRRWLALGLIVWIGGASVATVRRNLVWRSTDTVFEDLRKRHPESSRLQFRLGQRFEARGDWEEAKRWIRLSLETWPYHAARLAEYSSLLRKHGELEEAEAMAVRALELNPNERSYHLLLTLIRLRRGDTSGALQAIENGLEYVGPDADLYLLQADVYAGLGEYSRATDAQALAVRWGKRSWAAWLRLARFRVAAGETAAGLTALDSARRAPGADLAALDSIGRVWRSVQQRPEGMTPER